MPHHVQKVKFVDYLLGAQPNLQELPELVEAQFEGLVLEALMELPRLPRFGLKHKVLLNQGLYLLLGGYLGDVFPNIDKRAVELELIIEEFRKDELHLRVELSNFQTLEVLLLELPDHIGVVGYHGLEEPRIGKGVLVKGDFLFEVVLVEVIAELVLTKHDVMIDQIFPDIARRDLLLPFA